MTPSSFLINTALPTLWEGRNSVSHLPNIASSTRSVRGRCDGLTYSTWYQHKQSLLPDFNLQARYNRQQSITAHKVIHIARYLDILKERLSAPFHAESPFNLQLTLTSGTVYIQPNPSPPSRHTGRVDLCLNAAALVVIARSRVVIEDRAEATRAGLVFGNAANALGASLGSARNTEGA